MTNRRNTELGLMLLAVIITAGAYVLASLGAEARIPANVVPFLVIVLGLLLGAHVALRRLAPDADPILLPVAAVLNGLGYVLIAGLPPMPNMPSGEELARQQALWTAIGVGAFIATLVVVKRPRDLERYRYTFALVGIGLLLLPLIPGIGREINGSRIWVGLGPVNFQPGEVAKVVLALFFAAYLADQRELIATSVWKLGPLRLPDPKYLGPVVIAWLVTLVVMVYQKDLGSSLMFFALFVVMLWVATDRPSFLVLGGGLFAAGAWFAWSAFSHVRQRVDIWLDPWQDPSDSGYQIIQGLFAMGFGGLAGTGLGLGSSVRIPASESDYIFAVVVEQLGLLGGTVVIVAFLLMVGAGLRIASLAEHAFDKLLATGLTLLLGVQAFLIIGGVTRLLPLTGVTLPFMSYGGSSLVVNYVLLALLLRISDRRRATVPSVDADTGAMPAVGGGHG
ncbi:FtsW/RodA/SpoVE family cell cycle protein [Rhabdothermincola salaria]|uniref:FtsW/RodA/SpoVE family cell cycle protein n=1 Tax=Rhabdothermincola salaria TaxID=2903142 RepID=UPI001E617238|nr:FtsW/RodA/SpoVE family cell cycle protein [Rhabdothermincola salaria]